MHRVIILLYRTNYFVGRYKDYNVAIEFENLIEDVS